MLPLIEALILSRGNQRNEDEVIKIRYGCPADIEAIQHLYEAAFAGPGEAALVNALRGDGKLLISLVAEQEGEIVGHIAFSRVFPEQSARTIFLVGLAPMAALPGRQRKGIGSRLVQKGLRECRRIGVAGVVVLGHPEYYPRFGFQLASRFGLHSEYDVLDELFMALDLVLGAFSEIKGLVRYQSEFGAL